MRTVPVDDAHALLARLPAADSALAWVRDGEGMVGWGEALRLDTKGPDRFTEAVRWWHQVCQRLPVEDEVGLPGTGPVAFGSFAFADAPGESVLVVPRTLVGRRAGAAWVTTVTSGDASLGDAPGSVEAHAPPEPPLGVRYAAGSQPVTAWHEAVAEAVRRMRATRSAAAGRPGPGEVDPAALAKVVLAMDLLVTADEPLDPRFLLERLAERYPGCWTFAVDGLVGATPELLVRRLGSRVTSSVLAGTARREYDPGGEAAVADRLLHSSKDLAEHEYAVRSLADALAPFCADLDVPQPRILQLANVLHLATDVTGHLTGDPGSMELAASVHPTAAVGGTPTDSALDVIDELERMDRGRYAGPVGWTDSRGDGEWAIALRCAQLDGSQARLFAGCGIVADSDPDAEVAEAQAKFVPMRDALEGS
ncbi:MAG: isochorismate synthase [Actinomycetes bacterium]